MNLEQVCSVEKLIKIKFYAIFFKLQYHHLNILISSIHISQHVVLKNSQALYVQNSEDKQFRYPKKFKNN